MKSVFWLLLFAIAAAAAWLVWRGLRNWQARNNMDAMKAGELGFFYHSSCKPPGIAGISPRRAPSVTAFHPERPARASR
jgi:predicted RNA-binding protein with PUA-like domain